MSILQRWKIHYWPIFSGVLLVSAFVITYIISVFLNHHVYGLFPYISDTGTLPPESCIFSQFFNLSAVSLFITFYIRYKQVQLGIATGNIKTKNTWNVVAFGLSICMSLGISIAGNFQETEVEGVHTIGAFLGMGLAIPYLIIQTAISRACFKSKRDPNYGISKTMLVSRLLLLFIVIGCFLVVIICGITSRLQFTGKLAYYWTEADGGYPSRLASTFTEWIVVISILVYIGTYTSEFKRLKFGGVVITNLSEDISTNMVNV